MNLTLVQYPNFDEHGLAVRCTYNCSECQEMAIGAVWRSNQLDDPNQAPNFECPLPTELKNAPRSQAPYFNKFDVLVEVTDGHHSLKLYHTVINIYETCQSFIGYEQCSQLSPSCSWNITASQPVCTASNANETHLNAEFQAKVDFIDPKWSYLSKKTILRLIGHYLDTDITVSIGNNDCKNFVMKQEGRLVTCEFHPSESSKAGNATVTVKDRNGETIPCDDCGFGFETLDPQASLVADSLKGSAVMATAIPTRTQTILKVKTVVSLTETWMIAVVGGTCFLTAVCLFAFVKIITMWRSSRKTKRENDHTLRRLSQEFQLDEPMLRLAQQSFPGLSGNAQLPT